MEQVIFSDKLQQFLEGCKFKMKSDPFKRTYTFDRYRDSEYFFLYGQIIENSGRQNALVEMQGTAENWIKVSTSFVAEPVYRKIHMDEIEIL